jgi:hypothetical protein
MQNRAMSRVYHFRRATACPCSPDKISLRMLRMLMQTITGITLNIILM